MNTINIFTTLSNEIESLTKTFSTEVMQNITTNITPIISIALVIYFITYGLLIMNQIIQEPLQSFLMELVKIGIITGIALAGGLYQSKIADAVISLPDDFAKIAFNNADNAFSVADNMLTVGFNKALDLISETSFLLDPADSIVKVIIALIIGISTAVMGGIGGSLLLLIKINCVILASIAPIFILSLLFKQTRQLFSNWLSELIGYCIFSLMLTIIFIFMLKISEKYLSAIQGDDNAFIATLVFLILLIVSGFLFFEAKNMAQRLSGVFSMGLGGRLSDFAGNMANKAAGKAINQISKAVVGGTAYNATQNLNKSWRKKDR